MDSIRALSIRADLKELERMRRFIEEQATALRVDASAVYDLLLAINEMVTNIIVHGYRGGPGAIEIALHGDGDALVICLRDHAPPFDPTVVPAPNTTLPLHLRPPGGMGIYLTRQLMDTLDYRIIDHGGNELTMIKRGVIAS